jgi:hypothetical protein
LSAIGSAYTSGGLSKGAFHHSLKAYRLNCPKGNATLRTAERNFSIYQKFRAENDDPLPKFHQHSILNAAEWGRSSGLLTMGTSLTFLSAMNPLHHVNFGTDLNDFDIVSNSRKASRALAIKPASFDPKWEPYPSVAGLFASFLKVSCTKCTGKTLKKWCDRHLKVRFGASLTVDICGRGGELAKIVLHLFNVDQRGLKFYFWNLKTAVGKLVPCFINHCHGPYKKEICTPCLAKEFVRRFGKLNRAKDVACTLLDVENDPTLVTPGLIRTSGLFPFIHPDSNGLYFSLGPDACGKFMKQAFKEAGIKPSIPPHKARGMSASKVVNMGMSRDAALTRGRWSPSSTTFEKSYFRATSFLEHNPKNAYRTFEVVVRLSETILV